MVPAIQWAAVVRRRRIVGFNIAELARTTAHADAKLAYRAIGLALCE